MNTHLILRVVSKVLIPLILLFALYVQFHGEYGAGGGFQAGVIAAAGVILHALVFGVAETRKALPPIAARIGIALGVLIYGGVGFIGMMLGGEYLNYTVLHPDVAHATGQHIGIIAVEIGVLTTVFSVMVLIFYVFSDRTPDIPDDEW